MTMTPLSERLAAREAHSKEVMLWSGLFILAVWAVAILSMFFASQSLAGVALGITICMQLSLNPLFQAYMEEGKLLLAEQEAEIAEIERAIAQFEAEAEARMKERNR